MMASKQDFEIKALSSTELVERLEGCSPLQASKVLLDVELYDLRYSLEVLQTIEEQMADSQADIGESLVKPILLNVCDGLVSHPKLKLSKKGLTASRLVSELQSFSYDGAASMVADHRLDKQRLDEHTRKQRDDKGPYKGKRKIVEDTDKLDDYLDRRIKNNRRIESELEVNDQGQKRYLYRRSDVINQAKKEQGGNYSKSEINVDHQIPLKHAFEEYGQSKAISLDDLKTALNQDANFKNISGKLNTSKGEKSWSEYQQWVENKRCRLEDKQRAGTLSKSEQQELNDLPTKKTLDNALEAEKTAKAAIESDLNKVVANKLKTDRNMGKKLAKEAYGQAKDELEEKGIGELIILIIKPIFFELRDILQHGVLHDLETYSKLDAIGLRFKRAYHYITVNLEHVGFDVIKDALKNFVKYLINAVVNLFVGMLKRALKIISEGFNAIIQAIKILFSDSTPTQKADAITKLLATTVVTYVSFTFEQVISPYVDMIPVVGEHLKEATSIMVSGIGSALVVWLLDQVDIFSTKAELRTKRVKEVFEMRIQQIKDNTDAFEQASIAKLARDKLQFRSLTEHLSRTINDDSNVNSDVEAIADFMKIDLKIRSNDDFMALLENNNTLEIA
ncbi:DNA repair protein [bacterium 19MO03SA05]|uniref:DNA repair protein n=1 Tax=bacterium 19MO03SA05 TaxID=2920620 RepID=A0AAU6VBT9_UNCXX|nr:DNA repair protein [Vibrio sp. A14(2019)]